MFFLGMVIERVALRPLAGRPIIMILMMTMGLDIFLHGTTLAIWGATSRPMNLGVSYDPLFLGPILLSRVNLMGAGVTAVLFVARSEERRVGQGWGRKWRSRWWRYN